LYVFLMSETVSLTSWTPLSTTSVATWTTVFTVDTTACLTSLAAWLTALHRPENQPQPMPDGSLLDSGLLSPKAYDDWAGSAFDCASGSTELNLPLPVL